MEAGGGQGELGRIFHLSASVLWNRGESYYRQADWRGRWESDGGVLMNQCIHNIDLLRYLGGEAAEVFRLHRPAGTIPYIEGKTWASGLCGSQMGLMVRWKAPAISFPKTWRKPFRSMGEKGRCGSGEIGEPVGDLPAPNPARRIFPPLRKSLAISMDLATALYRDVAECIQTGRQPLCNGEDGLQALELVLSCLPVGGGTPVGIPPAERRGGPALTRGRFDR